MLSTETPVGQPTRPIEVAEADLMMFVRHPYWLMYTDFKSVTRSVYVALWSHHRDASGETVYPGIPRLAALANCSQNRARQSVRELEKAGLVVTEPRLSDRNQYHLVKPELWQVKNLLSPRFKLLTRTPSNFEVPPSNSEVPPSNFEVPPSNSGAEVDPRKRSRNQIQEPDPPSPASGGGEPLRGSQGAARQDEANGFPGALSLANDSGTDFPSLRARLERHV